MPTTSALKWKTMKRKKNKIHCREIKLTFFRWNPICPLISNPFNRKHKFSCQKKKKERKKRNTGPFIMLGTQRIKITT